MQGGVKHSHPIAPQARHVHALSRRSNRRAHLAVLCSLGMHTGATLFAALMVAFFSKHSESPLPERLTFIFLPAQEVEASRLPAASQPRSANTAQSPLGRSTPPAFDLSGDAKKLQAVDAVFQAGSAETPEETPYRSQIEGPGLIDATPAPNYLTPDAHPTTLQASRFYSPQPRHALIPDNQAGTQKRLSPPALAIPFSQQKRLLKKLKKITERFRPAIQEDTVLVFHDHDRQYAVAIRHQEAESSMDFDALEVTVTIEQYGKTFSSRLTYRRVGFSQFAQFVDYWDPYVMVHDDRFDGRFHTNTPFKMSSSNGVHPHFADKVTAPDYQVYTRGGFGFFREDSIFRAGVETGVAPIEFPKNLERFYRSFSADSTTLVFHDEVWLEFKREGTVYWRTKKTALQQGMHRFDPESPFLILGLERQKLHLRGTVRGKVLVYSRGHLAVDGSVTYARSPEIFQDSEDFLGLVSERDIQISPPEVTGEGDLYLYAAMLAKGRFVVQNYTRPSHRTLFIYGSLSAGSISATEPRFATRIRFDRRLRVKRPPFFPTADRYELAEWDRRWQMQQQSTPAVPKM